MGGQVGSEIAEEYLNSPDMPGGAENRQLIFGLQNTHGQSIVQHELRVRGNPFPGLVFDGERSKACFSAGTRAADCLD